MHMELLERFLKYVGFDTQSDENSTTFPSTEKQKVLLACLAEEMKALGGDGPLRLCHGDDSCDAGL